MNERAQPENGPGPWRRWFARAIDNLLVGLALNVLLPASLTLHYVGDNEPLALWLRSYFAFWIIYLVVEAIFLAALGATPGKLLLGLRVQTPTGQRPAFVQALARTIRCWLMGYGVGFPLFAWVTMLVSYRQLRRDGITPWDRATGLVVCMKSGATRQVGGQ